MNPDENQNGVPATPVEGEEQTQMPAEGETPAETPAEGAM